MIDLKPCPFCGPGGSKVSLCEEDGYWRIRCGACGASSGILPVYKKEQQQKSGPLSVDDLLEWIDLDNRDRIVSKWNTRHQEGA